MDFAAGPSDRPEANVNCEQFTPEELFFFLSTFIYVAMSISPLPPEPVRYPVMYQNWESLTFLHWRYHPDVLRPFIPKGLSVDLFDGAAWVSVAPFLITGMRAPFTPALPWLSRFPETNVRTYVTYPGGYPGIWFFSLDASRLAAVAGARASYGLPYMWSRMQVNRDGAHVRYTAKRRWPDSHATYDIRAAPGRLFEERELTDLDHFLTARFRLYTVIGGRLGFAQIEHAPWPLASAQIEHLDQTLIETAGLPPPFGDPVVHYSAFIHVRIGRPQLL